MQASACWLQPPTGLQPLTPCTPAHNASCSVCGVVQWQTNPYGREELPGGLPAHGRAYGRPNPQFAIGCMKGMNVAFHVIGGLAHHPE
jgi:hypothetical protein